MTTSPQYSMTHNNTASIASDPQKLGFRLILLTKIPAANQNCYEGWTWNHLKYHVQNHTKQLIGNDRNKRCLRQLAPLQDSVQIHVKDERAHYRNLYRCGSIWLCPCCSDTITNHRRSELATINASLKMDTYMATLTIGHHEWMSLSELVNAVTSAHDRMTRNRPFRRIKTEFGIIHTVKALELTVGANGWHPHLHLLYFCDGEIKPAALHKHLSEVWRGEILKQGFVAVSQAQNVIETDDKITEYIAKYGHHPEGKTWSAESEITRQPAKRGKDGLSPIELMMAVANPELEARHKLKAERWLIEYAEAMKGKHHIQFSRGLKKEFDLLPDDQIVAQEAQDYPLLARLYPDDWGKVLRTKSRGRVLEIASENDSQKLFEFIDQLEK